MFNNIKFKNELIFMDSRDMFIFKGMAKKTDFAYCFLDSSGNKVDIKFFNSSFIQYDFSLDTYIFDIKDSIDNGISVIIDISGSNKADLDVLNKKLQEKLTSLELDKLKIVDSGYDKGN